MNFKRCNKRIFKCLIFSFLIFFFNSNVIYAYTVTFNQAWGDYIVRKCETGTDGKLDSDCVDFVSTVCYRWSENMCGTSRSTCDAVGFKDISAAGGKFASVQWCNHICAFDKNHPKNGGNFGYCKKDNDNSCKDKGVTDNREGALKNKVFSQNTDYYCVSGSSRNDAKFLCYECSTDNTLFSWQSSNNTFPTTCSGYWKQTTKSYDECVGVKPSACYVCKDEGKGHIKGWGTSAEEVKIELSNDDYSCSTYEKDETISEENCNISDACYVCNDDGKENIMGYGSSAKNVQEALNSKGYSCNSYKRREDIPENDCKVKKVCYECSTDKYSLVWASSTSEASSIKTCSRGSYVATDIARDDCNSSDKKLKCNAISSPDGKTWNVNRDSDGISCENDELGVSSDLEADFDSCKKEKEISNSIYILSNSDCSGNKVQIGDNFYIKVEVITDILIHQTGKFKFGGINEDVVKAGKGFTIGTTTYENKITWINSNLRNIGTSSYKPYYKHVYSVYNKDSNGACNEVDTSFSLAGKTFYYKNENGRFSGPTDLETASFEAISIAVNNYLNEDSSNYNNIKFKSHDSNDYTKDVLVDGVWTNEEDDSSISIVKGNGFTVSEVSVNSNSNFGKKIIRNYEYNLADSAVYVSGDDYAKALYAEDAEDAINKLKAVNTGKKFYVDFKWVYGGYWPFNLDKDVNPSLVDGMTWTLNGTCGVNVEDGYYNEAGGDGKIGLNYKYRSISLSKPFPKASNINDIPVNWQNLYSINTDFPRIKDTKNNGIHYSLLFTKLNSSDIVTISNINNITRSYGSFEGISSTGSTNFLAIFNGKNRNVINAVEDTHYCGLGFFSEVCNQVS